VSVETLVQRYTAPVIARWDRFSDHVATNISDKIDVIKDKIDSFTRPGTAERCVDSTLLLVGGLLSTPFILKTVANVCWANLKGFSPDRVTLEGQDFVRLYRGITKQEFNLLMADPKGPLFGSVMASSAYGVRDVLSHVLLGFASDRSRVFTSFSTEKHLAAQFAGVHDSFGAIASFLVPVSLYAKAFCGMNIHREVLLPTGEVDLSMITSVELRSKEDLMVAKEKEIFYAINHGPTEESHKFETTPLLTFDPKNTVQRAAAFLRVQGLV
jgi:hypothetical protein